MSINSISDIYIDTDVNSYYELTKADIDDLCGPGWYGRKGTSQACGFFEGIEYDVVDGCPGLTDCSDTFGWTAEELNDIWLPLLSKFIKESA